MPYMKHYVTNKKLSEKAKLLILIWKDDFNTMKPTGTMGAWYHWLFSDWEISKETLNWKKALVICSPLGAVSI